MGKAKTLKNCVSQPWEKQKHPKIAFPNLGKSKNTPKLTFQSAMIADAAHSLADSLSDLIVFLSVRIGSRPTDGNHDYGYGKYETLATGIIGLILLGVGGAICYEAIEKVIAAVIGETLEQPRGIALTVAVISVLMKEWVFRYMYKVGKQWGSDAVIANAWHHRSDALSSLCTTFGIAGAALLGPKWAVLDPIAAAIMGAVVVRMACKLTRKAVGELTEHAIPTEQKEIVRNIVKEEAQVEEILQLQTRKIGNDIAINPAHCHVAPNYHRRSTCA